MRIAIIGTGHVGLVSCASFAALGHEVIGTDAQHEKIVDLQQGRLPFFEPDLEDLVDQGVSTGRLSFTTTAADAVRGAEAVFLCVGTPPRASGEANLVAVEEAARSVACHLEPEAVLVEKSTVPNGTARQLVRMLRHERAGLPGEIHVVSNPEFLREGKAVQDSLEPDRILIGTESDKARAVMGRVYKPLTDKGILLLYTDINTAEISKHACNAFLALKISYINAVARLCERAGADVDAVAKVMGADDRIGPQFLQAGLGYGGYCFPKDLQAFERLSARLGYDFGLLREVERINDEAVEAALEKVRDALWNLEDKRVGILGLAFKPETDDTRFSPALQLARRLIEEGADVVGYDPQAEANAKQEVPELRIAACALECAEGAHCLVVGTDWEEFRQLNLTEMREVMAYPVLVDARNLFSPDEARAAKLTLYPTGKKAVRP